MKSAEIRVVTALVLLLALECAMPNAKAGSITYNVALDITTQPGFVPLFDPSLGTLTEVILSASGYAVGQINFAPDLLTSGTYSQTVGIVLIPWVNGVPNGSIDLGSQTQFVDFSSSTPTPLIQTGSPFSFTSETLSGLDQLQGIGQANVQMTASFFLTSPPVLQQQDVTYGGGGTASLTYVYTTAVPEPAAMTMGLTAVFVGIGFWLFRRR